MTFLKVADCNHCIKSVVSNSVSSIDTALSLVFLILKSQIISSYFFKIEY